MKKNKKTAPPLKDSLDRLDSFLVRHSRHFLWPSLFLALLFSFLVMDMKISMGGDDATYIVKSWDFIHHFRYPSFQGPLYPVVLSPFILIFGIRIFLLKMLSFIFLTGFIFFFYKSYHRHVPSVLLLPVVIMISVCGAFLFYGSQIYSEAFFMFLQILLFYFFFRYFISDEVQKLRLSTGYKYYLVVALLLLLSALGRSIGYAAIVAVILYFVVTRQWKPMLWMALSFVLLSLTFGALKLLLWHETGFQIQSQTQNLLLKNWYNPAYGMETAGGFLKRILENSNLYISQDFYGFLGLRSDNAPVSPVLTVLTYILFGLAFFWAWRKNRYLLFTGIYLVVMVGVTFILLQSMWHQYRMVVIYFPMMMLFLLSGLYYLFKIQALKRLRFLLIILMLLMTVTTFIKTTKMAQLNNPSLKAYLTGDDLYGYTPDYVNYIRMSRWAAKQVPEDQIIAARKSSISFVYTNGRQFEPIYTIPATEADDYVKKMNRLQQHYIVADVTELQKVDYFKPYGINLWPYTDALLTGLEYDQSGLGKNTFNYCVFILPDTLEQIMVPILKERGVAFDTDMNTCISRLRDQGKGFVIYEPDVLVASLRNRNISYLILASLRRTPTAKTNLTINTIERYVNIIQIKYPGLFTKVMQYGKNEEEPALLVKINYDRM